MHLILTYFDAMIGPRVFTAFPAGVPLNESHSKLLLDILNAFNEESLFEVRSTGEMTTRLINKIFYLPSPWARGKKELLMITAILDGRIDLGYMELFLEGIIKELLDEPDIYKGLYTMQRCGLDRVSLKEECSVIEAKGAGIRGVIEANYLKLKRKLDRQAIFDKLFDDEPLPASASSAEVFKAMARSFITIVDARTNHGELVLYDVGSSLAHKFADLFNGDEIEKLLVSVSDFWKRHALGEIDDVNFDSKEIFFSVYECFECSHFPSVGRTVCKFDEGFLTSLIELKTGSRFDVKEIECFGTGKNHCRFSIRRIDELPA